MTQDFKIAVLVGSLRRASINRALAHAAIKLSQGGFAYEIVEIGALPLYNQDLEDEGEPEAWTEFRAAIRGVDGLLIVTPEYNRGVAPALKNALDIGSRPHGRSVWSGKPAAVLSASPGPLGGFNSNQHMRQSLANLSMPTLGQPETYLGHAANLIADDFTITVEASRTLVARFVAAYEAWVKIFVPAKA